MRSWTRRLEKPWLAGRQSEVVSPTGRQGALTARKTRSQRGGRVMAARVTIMRPRRSNQATPAGTGHAAPTPPTPCRLCDDCHGGSPTDCRRPGSHGPPLATRYRAVSLAFDVRRRRLTSELQHRVQPFSRRGPGRWFRDGYDQRTRGDLSHLPVQLYVRLRQVYQPRDPGIRRGWTCAGT